jgi:hypothetical protein
VTRDEAVAHVAQHGWTMARTTKRGYLIMRCSCGSHQETLHKTPSNPQPLQAEGRTHGLRMFGAGTVKHVPRILVELDARLTPHERLSDDAITDIIEAVVDVLDALAVEPSVGTTRAGDAVDVKVSLVVEAPNEMAAVRMAAPLIEDAFARVRLDTTELFSGLSLRSSALAPA